MNVQNSAEKLSTETLQLASGPELIFGLIAPIGVDLDLITEVLETTLHEMSYRVQNLRLTRLMREIPVACKLHDRPYIQSFKDRIAYANEVRRQLGNEALATLAISAIRVFRSDQRQNLRAERGIPRPIPAAADSVEADEEAPLPHQAYIIRQIKRPEEVALLRGVYGRQFILVAGYAPQDWRTRRIAELERRSQGGLVSEVETENAAHSLGDWPELDGQSCIPYPITTDGEAKSCQKNAGSLR